MVDLSAGALCHAARWLHCGASALAARWDHWQLCGALTCLHGATRGAGPMGARRRRTKLPRLALSPAPFLTVTVTAGPPPGSSPRPPWRAETTSMAAAPDLGAEAHWASEERR